MDDWAAVGGPAPSGMRQRGVQQQQQSGGGVGVSLDMDAMSLMRSSPTAAESSRPTMYSSQPMNYDGMSSGYTNYGGYDTGNQTSDHSHNEDIELMIRRLDPENAIKPAIAVLFIGCGIIFLLMGWSGYVMAFVHAVCSLGLVYAASLAHNILISDCGNTPMKSIAAAIREAAEGFLYTQYGSIAKMSVAVGLVLFFAFALREQTPGVQINSIVLAFVTALSFFIGAACSGLAGFVGVWISVRANLRVASAAAQSSTEGALSIAFRGGAFSAIVSACVCMMGLSLLYALFHFIGVSCYGVSEQNIPLMLAGYGFGASFVALFMQVAGGIYTKAADVGADMVGKIDKNIPEDDHRNPAVIADLVGDNVGDCAGSMADVFESIAAEILGTMILAGALVSEVKLDNASCQGYIFFPLVIHAFDVIVSSIGIQSVRYRSTDSSPLSCMKRGYLVTAVLATALFTATCRFMLYTPQQPGAWFNFWLCGMLGIATAFVLLFVCQYYTDYAYQPVRNIASASTTGHGTNVIQGLAVGFESTGPPAIIISFDLAAAYYLGEGAFPESPVTSGLFGTAVATMGILCTAVFILSMNNFGPIADNAGGIVEMGECCQQTRNITDSLDAIGNVTKAATKGYSVGASAMAFFLLFRAYMDDVSAFSGEKFSSVDVSRIEVLIGGLLGVAMVFVFTGWTMSAVGTTAQAVVVEVRRQFDEIDGIMEGRTRPAYAQCTSIVTRAALKHAAAPVALALLSPILVGLIFRMVGYVRGDRLLAVSVLAGFMIFASVTALLLAALLDNAGGAWDNAKKYIESGAHGGKGSDAHHAAVTGDTVGDPAKDTSGPSLHVVITTMSTTLLVLCPIFIPSANVV
eukprot:TRINITY_DN2550_c0_g1_i4.p1 TRINITY_DN2550_c0_g1~~TRINITY_DN2550_c0_g1_i4.p1  ORF type:complete len:860 (+),score=137.44 TRINITY_DN2550_c0_g1_i4:62-2641(+)